MQYKRYDSSSFHTWNNETTQCIVDVKKLLLWIRKSSSNEEGKNRYTL